MLIFCSLIVLLQYSTSVFKGTRSKLSFYSAVFKRFYNLYLHILYSLDALDSNAYAAYQASSDLKVVIEKWISGNTSSITGLKTTLSIRATLMTPVKPMLAEACKSIEQAFKKCPNGMFSEIKYDGERVQVCPMLFVAIMT